MGSETQSGPSGPNPLRAAWAILRARLVAPPRPGGSGIVDHAAFSPVLQTLALPNGLAQIESGALREYLLALGDVDPDTLDSDEAKAFWINLYNARAIGLAAEARIRGAASVLRVPGAFDRRDVVVAGEGLSLNDIEHGKIRRFGDPRIHGALVCGSISCPTLRSAPFAGPTIDAELDEQMRSFLALGGAWADRSRGVLSLSRVFLWYGADFVRPDRMPTVLSARKRAVARAASRWMGDEDRAWVDRTEPVVEFQPYDWGIGCSVA